MRRLLAITVTSVLVLASTGLVGAADPADARAIIDKAMKATGGEEKLAKVKAQTWSEKGTYYGMGDGLPYTGTYAMQLPDKFRMEIEGVFLMVLNGDKGWVRMNNNTMDMSKEQLEEQKAARYAGWVTTLVPLKDKAFTLTSLDEIKVDNKPAAGVKVARKGHQDVRLYFDKESGLLVKSEHRAKASDLGGKEVNFENFYSDYREVEGVKMPMKIVINRAGKKFVEAENSDVKVVDKLDDKLFEKP